MKYVSIASPIEHVLVNFVAVTVYLNDLRKWDMMKRRLSPFLLPYSCWYAAKIRPQFNGFPFAKSIFSVNDLTLITIYLHISSSFALLHSLQQPHIVSMSISCGIVWTHDDEMIHDAKVIFSFYYIFCSHVWNAELTTKSISPF